MDFDKKTWNDEKGNIDYYVGGTGRPLLFLHSAGGPRIRKHLEGLAQRHKVYVPVMPGYDETPLFEEVKTLPALARLMGEFADEIVGEDCDLMGESFGGWVALWLAVERPELVDQIVLVAPAGLRPDGKGGLSDHAEELRRQLYRYPEKIPEDAPPPDPEARRRRLAHYDGLDAAMDSELQGRLGEIEQLTLVLLGEMDTVIPKETGWLLKERLPRAYLTYMDDAAHDIAIDQPERLEGIISRFLDHGEAFLLKRNSEAA